MFRNFLAKVPSVPVAKLEIPGSKAVRCQGSRPSSESRYVCSTGNGNNRLISRKHRSLPPAGHTLPNVGGAKLEENLVQRSYAHHAKHPRKTNERQSRTSRREPEPTNKNVCENPPITEKKYYFHSSDQYELEAARPKKKIKYMPFNADEFLNSIDKESNSLEHLQPGKMTPYGSRDCSNIVETIQSTRVNIEPLKGDLFEVEEKGDSVEANEQNYRNRREYSTKPIHKSDNLQKLIQKLPPKKNQPFIIKPVVKPTVTPKLSKEESERMRNLGDEVEIARKCKKLIELNNNMTVADKSSIADGSFTTKYRLSTPFGNSYSDSVKKFDFEQEPPKNIRSVTNFTYDVTFENKTDKFDKHSHIPQDSQSSQFYIQKPRHFASTENVSKGKKHYSTTRTPNLTDFENEEEMPKKRNSDHALRPSMESRNSTGNGKGLLLVPSPTQTTYRGKWIKRSSINDKTSNKCPKNEEECCTKKKSIPKFDFPCYNKAAVERIVVKKPKAPFPAFTDCLDGELNDNLSECPLDKDKIDNLQPKYLRHADVKEKLLPPIEPSIQTIDTKLEEDCVREKLCLEKRTISQDCKTFGKSIQPMRAKDYIKKRKSKECEQVEKLKKQDRWPLKHFRKHFCTTSRTCLNFQTRNLTNFPRFSSMNILNINLRNKCKQEMKIQGKYYVPKNTSHSTSYRSSSCLAKNLKKLNQPNAKYKLSVADSSLQPKYPIIPENGSNSSNSINEFSSVDRSLNDAYLRKKLGIKNEGRTWDCESFGYGKKKQNETFIEKKKECPCNMCTKMKKTKSTKNIKSNTSIDKQFKPCTFQKDKCKKPDQCVQPKKTPPTCVPKVPPKPVQSTLNTMWAKIVNYFKARPNCPAPDEWKKKRLRERAEKAAKAAGLALCDPKDLPKSKCEVELPQVITPQSKIKPNAQSDNKQAEQCQRTLRNAKAAGFGIFTLPSRVLQQAGNISDDTKKCGLVLAHNNLSNKDRSSVVTKQFHFNIANLESGKSTKRFYSNNSNWHKSGNFTNFTDENDDEDEFEFIEDSNITCGDTEDTDLEMNKFCCNKESSDNADDTVSESSISKTRSLFDTLSDHNDDCLEVFPTSCRFKQFQDYWCKKEAFRDLTAEELETLKTNELIKELNYVLEKIKKD